MTKVRPATAGEDFAFLDEELDVFRGLDGQQGAGVRRDALRNALARLLKHG
jgi:hypothetical protein